MQGLGVRVHGLAQSRQGLVAGLRQQPQVQRGELLKVPHVMKQRTVLRAVLVDEGHRRGGRTRPGHGQALLWRPQSADGVPKMTDEGLVGGDYPALTRPPHGLDAFSRRPSPLLARTPTPSRRRRARQNGRRALTILARGLIILTNMVGCGSTVGGSLIADGCHPPRGGRAHGPGTWRRPPARSLAVDRGRGSPDTAPPTAAGRGHT
jgi:hypothetical protein